MDTAPLRFASACLSLFVFLACSEVSSTTEIEGSDVPNWGASTDVTVASGDVTQAADVSEEWQPPVGPRGEPDADRGESDAGEIPPDQEPVGPTQPVISVSPELDTFSYISPLAIPITRQINVGNLGNAPLRITDFSFTANSSADFSWVLKPTAPLTLEPNDFMMFKVKFACDVLGPPCNNLPATINISSNDPGRPVVPVQLTSQIKATVATPEPCGLLTPSDLDFGSVTRGNSKTLTATLSNCSEEVPLVVNNVARSQFLFQALTDEFQLNLEGQTPLTLEPGETYDLEVTYTPQLAGLDAGYFRLLTDDPNEPYQQLNVNGVGQSPPPEEIGLTIRLSWDTNETDVDSHLLAPSAAFFDCDMDCHFGNPSPDWGLQGDWTDDPFLDVDDVDGYGPENTNVSEPSVGAYRFFVHYYADTYDGSSPQGSNATVELLSYGSVVATFGPVNLPKSNWVWEVVEVQWPPQAGALQFTELNTTYPVAPSVVAACGLWP